MPELEPIDSFPPRTLCYCVLHRSEDGEGVHVSAGMPGLEGGPSSAVEVACNTALMLRTLRASALRVIEACGYSQANAKEFLRIAEALNAVDEPDITRFAVSTVDPPDSKGTG